MVTTFITDLLGAALILGTAYLLWSLFTRKARREDEHRSALVASGHKVWATVVATRPTGQSATNNVHRQYAQQYYVQLDLELAQSNGSPLRCTTRAITPPDWHALQPGDQVQVYQDPRNPTNVALDTIMSPHYIQAAGGS